jgi:hypothetical protein
LTRTHNLGSLDDTGQPAIGVTIRGSAMVSAGNTGAVQSQRDATRYPSTLLFEPRDRADIADCADRAGGGFSTGARSTKTASWITFEDLALAGGPSFDSCLLNETWAELGDAIHITVRRVRLVGDDAARAGGIFLSNASYAIVDASYFSGLMYGIASSERIDRTNGSYVDNLVVTNSIFYSRTTFANGRYALVDANPMINLPARQGVMGLHVSGNAFEYGPSAIYIYLMEGGDIRGNWFRGEGTDSPRTGTWIALNWGDGAVVAGNYLNLGYNDIVTQAYAEVIEGNFLRDWYGTALVLQAGSAIVRGNAFWQSLAIDGQRDIDVLGGEGHQIGPNASTGTSRRQIRLRSGTSGILFAGPNLLPDIDDESSGRWTLLNDRAPATATHQAPAANEPPANQGARPSR